MKEIPKPYEIYQHENGSFYQILLLAEHAQTGERLVVYQNLGGGFEILAEPLSVFWEKADIEPEAPDSQEETQLSGNSGTEGQELDIDPLVLKFLDADTYEEKLNILTALQDRITDDMLNTMAVAVDVEVSGKDMAEKYESLRNCIVTMKKYECTRLR